MNKLDTTVTRVPVLVWEGTSPKPRTVRVPATSDIPVEVWKTLNKVFLKRLAKGWFNPLDPADAYHFAVGKMLEANNRNSSLTGTTKIKYLVASVQTSLMYFFCRIALPARENAQALALWQSHTAAKLGLPEDEVDTASLLETLPAVPTAADARTEARRVLAELFPLLPQEIRRAFTAYIATDGNLFATAARLNMPRRTFFRKWKIYLATARKIAEEVL